MPNAQHHRYGLSCGSKIIRVIASKQQFKFALDKCRFYEMIQAFAGTMLDFLCTCLGFTFSRT